VIGGTVVLSGFMVLLICRIGVGIGEAGCTPPANSLIADYYPAAKRSSALGYYAMGVTLGTMLANAVGGQITDAFGWRAAFYALGIPGVLRILNPRFSHYRVPRFSDTPTIEIVLVDRKDLPSAGAGEAPIVGIAPAIGNAIFDAVGVRLRSLPLVPNGLKV
jgi:MFS family permease